MITKKLDIDIYGWTIHYTEVEKGDKSKVVLNRIRKFIPKKQRVDYRDWLNEVKENIDDKRTDGGVCSYWGLYRRTSVLIYRTTSKKQRRMVIAHELRHVVDQILHNHNIVWDKEAAAYLQGYIFMKLTK